MKIKYCECCRKSIEGRCKFCSACSFYLKNIKAQNSYYKNKNKRLLIKLYGVDNGAERIRYGT